MNCCGQVVSAQNSYPVLAQVSVTISFGEHEIVIPNLRLVSIGGPRVKVIIPSPLAEGADEPVGLSPDLSRIVAYEVVKTYCCHIGFGGNISDIHYSGSMEYRLPERIASQVRSVSRKEGVKQ